MTATLDANLNVIANSDIDPQLLAALTFGKDMKVIQALDDEPNDVGGLTAAELKAKFDEAGLAIQQYINETLVPAVLAEDATEGARQSAEDARDGAETDRAAAESARVQAEALREAAEQAREAAEAQRQNVLSDAEAARDAAAGAAQGAASAAASAAAQAEAAQQAARSAGADAQRAENAATHGPYVGENGNWMVWDLEAEGYRDSGIYAGGTKGEKGDKGDDGVILELNAGVFAMALSAEGHLLVAVNEDETIPPLEIDGETGHLLYKIQA